MSPVFVFGTLRHAPLRAAVAGEELAHRPAHLPGEAARRAPDGDWPVLVADVSGGGAEGLLLTPSEAALARLDHYEACFGYHRVPAQVETTTGPVIAEVWRPRESPPADAAPIPWRLSDWVSASASLQVRIAQEVMRRFGHQSPDAVAARFGIIRARAQAEVMTARWQRPGHHRPEKSLADVQVEKDWTPYADYFSVATLIARHRRFDGAMSAPVERSVFRVGDAVTLLPYDPVRDCVMFVEQLRFAALVQGDPVPWLLEPIAGMIDMGETPEAAGHREAAEEAGLTLGDLHFVARYYPSPGGVAQILHSYVAIADLPPDAAGIAGHPGEGEDIRSHILPFDTVMRMRAEGDLTDAASLISVQWLAQHRERLRSGATI